LILVEGKRIWVFSLLGSDRGNLSSSGSNLNSLNSDRSLNSSGGRGSNSGGRGSSRIVNVVEESGVVLVDDLAKSLSGEQS